MKILRSLSALSLMSLSVLGFSACRSEEPSDSDGMGGGGGEAALPVTVTFRAQFGDKPFRCGESYEGQGSTDVEVTPQDLRLYVSDVRLVAKDGSETAVELEARSPWQTPEVALLDFEDGKGACKDGNSETNALVRGTVPAGEYKGIRFSMAVPKALNHGDPATLPAPLQAGGMTWGWLFGYKFIRAEVVATRAPEEGELPGHGVFHLGSTGCDYRPGEGGAGGEANEADPGAAPATDCAQQNRNDIELDAFDAKGDVIVIDVSKMLSGVDLSGAADCHGMGPACTAYFPTVGIDISTGNATETQTVFRVAEK